MKSFTLDLFAWLKNTEIQGLLLLMMPIYKIVFVSIH